MVQNTHPVDGKNTEKAGETVSGRNDSTRPLSSRSSPQWTRGWDQGFSDGAAWAIDVAAWVLGKNGDCDQLLDEMLGAGPRKDILASIRKNSPEDVREMVKNYLKHKRENERNRARLVRITKEGVR